MANKITAIKESLLKNRLIYKLYLKKKSYAKRRKRFPQMEMINKPEKLNIESYQKTQ